MADAPFTTSDYSGLITSEHRGKPKFVKTVETTVQPASGVQAFLEDLPSAFDLDTAIGVQLDAVGAWVGVSRTISTCLISVWFSFDAQGLGFDQGLWKGEYDPEQGLYELDDDTYRALIRLKIKVNTWDGTLETARAAILDFYGTTDSYPFILDNQDMSMVVCIAGARPIMVMFAIYAGRYVEFKPAGVTLHTVVPSVEYTPAFGQDANSSYVAGFDTGSWVVDAESVLCVDDAEYEVTLSRFDVRYWTIDLPLTASAALVTTSTYGMTLYATLRSASDLVGLKWQSEDKWSHRGLGYYTSPNYTGCILDFDFTLTGLDGTTSGSKSGTAGLTLTVTDDEGVVYYIRLANYVTSGTINSGHIRLDFSGAPVLGGYDPDNATQRTIIPWHRITEFSIGFAPTDYDKDSTAPLAEKIDVVFTVTNMRVSGQNTTMLQRLLATPSHNVRMCDGGDDAYPLTPERIVLGLQQLGYSGQYVIYIGASHLHELTWNASAGSFLVDPSHPVSVPVRAWYQDLFNRLVEAGYDPVISQSYEIFAAMCPEAWQQKDYTGAGARTGWEPPSTLIAPTVSAAMNYLKSVALWMCGALDDAGGAVRYQVGEPWWWDGTYTGGGPCIYDETTTALYVSETGHAVPTPYLQSIYGSIGGHGDYLDWLAAKLGASTLWLRDAVTTAYPSATTYILLFTPQILAPTSEIVTRLNFPISAWAYPAYDVLQLEDYDWVIDADWENHARTLTAGTDTLGYPLAHIQYFGGFNLLASTATTIWPRISMVINEALGWGIQDVCVWARPQVWRDGWIPISGRLIGELGDSTDPGPDPITWVFPTDLQMVANTWGDIVLSFNPNQTSTGHTYTIEIMNGDVVKRTITVASPTRVDGRVQVEYPVEQSAPDWDFPPTYLKWRVRVDGGTVKTVMNDDVPVDNAAFVKIAIAFAGQSNALGHFTTLSGTDARKDLISAGALRRAVATQLGLRAVEVIPVQMAWGSSAADKLADDDPVSGVNYWWDVDAGVAGPRLIEAKAIMADLGVPLAAIIWAQGENDAGAMDPSAAPRTSSVSRYKTATLAIFQALRSAAGNTSLPIWIQTLGRGWWGDPPDPPEAGGIFYKAVRDTQVAIARADANVRIGSWVPGCEAISGYVQETGNVGWVHYTSSVYHAAAAELAEAIATPLDRIGNRPAWTLLEAPVLSATAEAYAYVVTWPAAPGVSYVLRNINVVTGDTISTTTVTATGDTARWVFTEDEQTAIYEDTYGNPIRAGGIYVTVYQLAGTIQGPPASLVAQSEDMPDYPRAPTKVSVAIVGDQFDVRGTWQTVVGKTYRARILDVEDNSVLWEETFVATSTTAFATYTTAMQQDAHDGHAGGGGCITAARIYTGGVAGPELYMIFNVGTLAGMVDGPESLSVVCSGLDVVVSWTSVSGTTYDISEYVMGGGGTVVASGTTSSWTWAYADQLDIYGNEATEYSFSVSVALTRGGVTIFGGGAIASGSISTLSGYLAPPTGLTMAWSTSGGWDIQAKWSTVVGEQYKAEWLSVADGTSIATSTLAASGTLSAATLSADEQITAYGAHARYATVKVRRLYGSTWSRATTIFGQDLWAPLLIGTTTPSLWSDAVRQQAILGASESSHATLFPRSGIAKVVKLANGTWGSAAANAVAYDYAAGVREDLSEGAATNLAQGSATQTITVTAQAYTLSFTGTGSVTLSGAYSGTLAGTGTNDKVKLTFTPTAGSLVLTVSGTIARLQLETGSIATSYIATTTGGGAVTRTTDTRAWSAAALAVVSVSAAQITWRGVRASGMTHTILRSAGSAAVGLLAASDTAAICKVPGNNSLGVTVAHGGATNIGASWSWSSSGTNAACNGTGATSASLTPSGTLSAIYFGDSTGLAAGTVIRTREIMVHSVAGNASAVLAQGRIWA